MKVKELIEMKSRIEKDILENAREGILMYIMDTLIRDFGDEEIFDIWLQEGVPDESTVDDCISLASCPEVFPDIEKCFYSIADEETAEKYNAIKTEANK